MGLVDVGEDSFTWQVNRRERESYEFYQMARGYKKREPVSSE